MVSLRPLRQLTLEVTPDFSALAGLREQLRRWLRLTEVPEPTSDETLLVATELCTNAIEASVPDAPVEVRLTNDGQALRLMVLNTTTEAGIEAPMHLSPGSLQERGRGLAIVRSLVDTFVMTSVDGRTVVRTMQLL